MTDDKNVQSNDTKPLPVKPTNVLSTNNQNPSPPPKPLPQKNTSTYLTEGNEGKDRNSDKD
jgi:hypothetical protein